MSPEVQAALAEYDHFRALGTLARGSRQRTREHGRGWFVIWREIPSLELRARTAFVC